ncbi:MAG: efflux RND transporter periplasmic adaptor subunit, partial [Halioglobus sp.]
VAPVEKRSMQPTLQLTGSITSKQSARLSAATAGLVTEVAVDAGTAVKAGDTLVRLDWELAQWQTKIAEAGLVTARLALEDAERRLREARTLAPQRSIAETVVRDLEAEVASDRAALERAKAEAGYRAGIGARHVLTAPFDGVVSAKLTEVGEWVTPGQPVLEIVAAGALRMEFPVTQEHRLALAVGNPIAYRLGNDDSERAAQVTTIVPIADPGARTFLIHAEPEADDSRMAPGMSVRGELAVGSGSKRLAVPRDAVLSFPDGRTVVWVIETSGDSTTAKETVVEIDSYFNGRAAIRAGLSLGQRVIVKGNEALQNGQTVRVVKGVDR